MFTVVIATRNRAASLEQALGAVRAQRTPAHEIVVVNDGSTDDTTAILTSDSLADLKVVHSHGVGVSAARNLGLNAATSEWVVFLDDDDLPGPQWLESFRDLIKPSVGIAFVGATISGSAGISVVVPRPNDALGGTCLFLTGTFAARRSLLLDIEGYQEGLSYAENTELAMRLMARCAHAGFAAASTPLPVLEIRRPTERRSARGRRQALLTVIDTHREAFAGNPRRLARWLSIAGVDAFKENDLPQSRALLFRAARAAPSARSWLRYVGAAVPPIGRVIWQLDRSTRLRAPRSESAPR